MINIKIIYEPMYQLCDNVPMLPGQDRDEGMAAVVSNIHPDI